MAFKNQIKVNSSNVRYTNDFIEVNYDYPITTVKKDNDVFNVSFVVVVIVYY